MELNKIYNEDCLETMARMPDNFVDVIITSPPYNKAGYEGKIRKRHKNDTWKSRNIDYNDNSNNDFMNELDSKWSIVQTVIISAYPSNLDFNLSKSFVKILIIF